MNLDMFCFQCEQTAHGSGCTKKGVCGKDPDTATMQDLLVYATKGLSQVAHAARQQGIANNAADRFVCEGTFSTLTNVNFDAERFVPLVHKAVELRDDLHARLNKATGNDAGLLAKIKKAVGLAEDSEIAFPEGPATFQPAPDLTGMVKQGHEHGIPDDPEPNADIKSLKETVIYGLKGACAYADHAAILGQESEDFYAEMHRLLAATLRQDLGLEDWVQLAMDCGQANMKAMELLDAANTGTYGHPTPTEVPLGAKQGPAICVSGHDLHDLELLLQQTEGKGITVYTHGEMLPCHGYPELKKYSHFYGHFGTAWQNQQTEFKQFPGPILMTTNCIQKPREEYAQRIFTTGLVGWPGTTHIGEEKDFTPLINSALEMGGFSEDTDKGTVMVGFARNAVLGVADKVVDLVKRGKIRHFFLVGGCDGAKPGRSYYEDFVDQVPEDCVVLTLACGKFRFFDKDLGSIEGIPRLLDIGQCNDAFSAIQIAVALAQAFDCEVNELPLSMVISWYEQKAVAILLTLLSLGIKDIRLGPTLPAFVSENVLNYLVENFDIKPISTPEDDLKAILG